MSCTPQPARTRTRREIAALGAVALTAVSSATLIAGLGATALGRAATAEAAGLRAGRQAGRVRNHGHAGRNRRRATGGHPSQSSAGPQRQMLESDQLWATIDVCRMGARPMIGVRGSMPSDGHPHDTMYMRFRLQYFDTTGKVWSSLEGGTSAGFTKLGTADATREAGRTFQLSPQPQAGAFKMRGLVEFQWRDNGKLRVAATRPTTTGHHSKVGAVPPGFSAATCTLE